MKTAVLNGAITEKTKPAAKKVKKGAVRFINGFSYDPHPRRSKFILLAKAAIPALLAGMFIARRRASS